MEPFVLRRTRYGRSPTACEIGRWGATSGRGSDGAEGTAADEVAEASSEYRRAWRAGIARNGRASELSIFDRRMEEGILKKSELGNEIFGIWSQRTSLVCFRSGGDLSSRTEKIAGP